VNFFVPRLIAFAFCLIAFGVGMYFQREERKRRELRKQQMANRSVADQYSAAQAMRSSENPLGLGRVQDQQVQSRYKH
jgi:hypothetical protein